VQKKKGSCPLGLNFFDFSSRDYTRMLQAGHFLSPITEEIQSAQAKQQQLFPQGE